MSGSTKNSISNPRASSLLDVLIQRQHLKNYAQLARLLEVAPPVLSKILHGKNPFGPSLILSALIVTGLTYAEFCNLTEKEKEAA